MVVEVFILHMHGIPDPVGDSAASHNLRVGVVLGGAGPYSLVLVHDGDAVVGVCLHEQARIPVTAQGIADLHEPHLPELLVVISSFDNHQMVAAAIAVSVDAMLFEWPGNRTGVEISEQLILVADDSAGPITLAILGLANDLQGKPLLVIRAERACGIVFQKGMACRQLTI